MFTAGASHMCMVHNSIFRGYNSIYHQAPHVAEADKADFIGYCLAWHKFLKSHAENKETSLFPKTEELLDDKTIWEESHKEHGMLRNIWGGVKGEIE
jgi:hemerythrin-like domain-containing protein